VRDRAREATQWVAGIFSTLRKPTGSLLRPKHPAMDIAAGTRAGNAPVEADATGAEDVIATSTAATAIAATVFADVRIDQDAPVSGVALTVPDEDEIKRRRELIRSLFNDYWSGRDDKPAAFVDRLNEAEVYLNERLMAGGELWELDGVSRKMLGLPAGSKSRGNGAA
jgi:hypothetical protein